MEGEAQVQDSQPVQTEAPVQQTETTDNQPIVDNSEQKPDGFDRVELPPEAQKRFDRVYGNMKRYENSAKELQDIVAKQFEIINGLQTGQQQIVNHLQTQDFTDAESRLNTQRDEAWSKGDQRGWHQANDQLTEIKLKKNLSLQQQRQAVPVQQQQPAQTVNSQDAVQYAVQRGEITPQDAHIFKSWATETDDTGNFKRPWVNAHDIKNTVAAIEGRAVFENPAFAQKSFAEKLREIDRRMGMTAPQQNNQQVLGAGNLTRGNKNSTIQLDPAIEKLAVRTKFGGPKAKTDQDHIDAWKRAVQKSSKGAKR